MVDLGEEERGLQAEGGHGVTVGLRHARDDSLEAQPPEIVGHPPGGVLLQTQAEQASDSRPKIHRSRISEAHRGGPLVLDDRGLLELLETGPRELAVVLKSLDLEKLAVALLAEMTEMREVLQALVDLEITRVVDRRLGA